MWKIFLPTIISDFLLLKIQISLKWIDITWTEGVVQMTIMLEITGFCCPEMMNQLCNQFSTNWKKNRIFVILKSNSHFPNHSSCQALTYICIFIRAYNLLNNINFFGLYFFQKNIHFFGLYIFQNNTLFWSVYFSKEHSFFLVCIFFKTIPFFWSVYF